MPIKIEMNDINQPTSVTYTGSIEEIKNLVERVADALKQQTKKQSREEWTAMLDRVNPEIVRAALGTQSSKS